MNNDTQKDVKIRKVSKFDKVSLINITFETAFLGRNGATIFDDPNLFFDSGYLYYYIFEKDISFVAEVEGKVIGYILCASSITKRNIVEIFYIIAFMVLPKLIFLRYKIGIKTLKYFFCLS